MVNNKQRKDIFLLIALVLCFLGSAAVLIIAILKQYGFFK